MKAFGWKRRSSGNLVKNTVLSLEEDLDEGQGCNIVVPMLDDCLPPVSKKRHISESDVAKSDTLVTEGSTLAESGKCWAAVRKWDTALLLTPGNSRIYEMKAQVLMMLGETFSAIKSAEKATKLDPTWWVAHQTHGRSLLDLGEVRKGLRSFCKAVHLNPHERELWKEDIKWARNLLERKDKAEKDAVAAAEEEEQNSTAQVTEMSDKDLEEFIKSMPGPHLCKEKPFTRSHCGSLLPKDLKDKQSDQVEDFITSKADVKHINQNYVFWRDYHQT